MCSICGKLGHDASYCWPRVAAVTYDEHEEESWEQEGWWSLEADYASQTEDSWEEYSWQGEDEEEQADWMHGQATVYQEAQPSTSAASSSQSPNPFAGMMAPVTSTTTNSKVDKDRFVVAFTKETIMATLTPQDEDSLLFDTGASCNVCPRLYANDYPLLEDKNPPQTKDGDRPTYQDIWPESDYLPDHGIELSHGQHCCV